MRGWVDFVTRSPTWIYTVDGWRTHTGRRLPPKLTHFRQPVICTIDVDHSINGGDNDRKDLDQKPTGRIYRSSIVVATSDRFSNIYLVHSYIRVDGVHFRVRRKKPVNPSLKSQIFGIGTSSFEALLATALRSQAPVVYEVKRGGESPNPVAPRLLLTNLCDDFHRSIEDSFARTIGSLHSLIHEMESTQIAEADFQQSLLRMSELPKLVSNVHSFANMCLQELGWDHPQGRQLRALDDRGDRAIATMTGATLLALSLKEGQAAASARDTQAVIEEAGSKLTAIAGSLGLAACVYAAFGSNTLPDRFIVGSLIIDVKGTGFFWASIVAPILFGVVFYLIVSSKFSNKLKGDHGDEEL